MPTYVVVREGETVPCEVVRYSSVPPARVLAAWAARGRRLVRLEPPGVLRQAAAIIKDPDGYRVTETDVVLATELEAPTL